jgi:hypothetical protein
MKPLYVTIQVPLSHSECHSPGPPGPFQLNGYNGYFNSTATTATSTQRLQRLLQLNGYNGYFNSTATTQHRTRTVNVPIRHLSLLHTLPKVPINTLTTNSRFLNNAPMPREPSASRVHGLQRLGDLANGLLSRGKPQRLADGYDLRKPVTPEAAAWGALEALSTMAYRAAGQLVRESPDSNLVRDAVQHYTSFFLDLAGRYPNTLQRCQAKLDKIPKLLETLKGRQGLLTWSMRHKLTTVSTTL